MNATRPNVQLIVDGAPVSADNPLPISVPVGAGLVIGPDGSLCLQAATGAVIGGVKIGEGLVVDAGGVLRARYLLQAAADETTAMAMSAMYPDTLFMWDA